MSPASKAKRKFSLDCPASDMPRNPIKAEYWQVSHGITRMFGNAEDKAPYAGALQLITTSLDYDLGAFWVVNDLRITFFFSRRRRHTRCYRDWSSDVCSSDLALRRRNAAASGSSPWRWRNCA